MDKKIAGLIGAMGALVAAPAAQAAIAPPATLDAAMQARSYADLLRPIPNALALLQASAAQQAKFAPTAPSSAGQANIREVDDHHQQHDHHHHHHNAS